ncbi:MAG: hypothetical protein JZU65_13875, partial [Chlorobium sp.]|nr:hypothetical protein [Chlorobium sp.]
SNIIVDCLVVLAAGSKPSWMPLLAFTLASGSLTRICFVGIATVSIYSFPLLFQEVAVSDYTASIKNAYEILMGVSAFSHNLTNGVRPFFEGHFATIEIINKYMLLFGAFYSISTLVFCSFLRRKVENHFNKSNIDIIIFTHIIICILLFNHPSPDYRLVVLLPSLAAIIVFLEYCKTYLQNEYSRVRWYILTVIFVFAVVVSWTNFYALNGFPVFVPVRAWLLLLADVTLLTLFRRIIILTKNKKLGVVPNKVARHGRK